MKVDVTLKGMITCIPTLLSVLKTSKRTNTVLWLLTAGRWTSDYLLKSPSGLCQTQVRFNARSHTYPRAVQEGGERKTAHGAS